ncbi:MAG TPA: DegT/DnrJ/EryC1/StrS family aminotransferase [Rectinemataceae bacterium]|nr:DegT/DnrJ/EryC1/StrS family aminotransferase [Rectinemataceae bacterium]
MSIPVFRSYIRRKDMDSVLNCLVTDSVGPGEYLERFTKAAREKLEFDFGFAVRSPYLALGLAFDALGLSEGDPVGIPALAPRYYLRVLEAKGLTPVFLDSVPESPMVDLGSLENMQLRPKAVVLFEALGLMHDPDAVRSLGIQVIEDMSQSLGGYVNETRAGALGDLTILGLEHGGLVTAGGGALLFAQGKREATVLRNLAAATEPEILMTDYNAALGLAQLRDLEAAIERRREYAAVFAQALAGTRHRVLSQPSDGEPGYWAFPVSLTSGMKDVRAYAKKKDVETLPAFEESLVGRGLVPEGSCPSARSLSLRCLLFPLHQRIGASGVQKISKVLATLP